MNKNKKLINSFKYAITGIITSIKKERNMKIHLSIMIIVIIFGIVLKISRVEWLICLILFGMVLSGELFNTAIETAVDISSPNISELAKKAKDISAGAVLISAIASAICGLIIFLPKIINLI